MPLATLATRQKLFIPLSDYGRTQGNDETLKPTLALAIHPQGQDYDTTDKGMEMGRTFRPFLRDCVVEEDIKMTSQCMLTFNDLNYQVSSALINGMRCLGNGSNVDILLGYGNQLNLFGRRFRLVGSYPQFPRGSEVPLYQVKGYDGRYKLIHGERLPRSPGTESIGSGFRRGVKKTPRIFKNKTDSDIVSELCWYHGFLFDGDPTTKKQTRAKKKGDSDWEFILSLARKNGYYAWVDFGEMSGGRNVVYGSEYVPGPKEFARYRQKSPPDYVLHFRKKPRLMEQGFVFTYGKDLLEFSVREEVTSAPTDVEVIYFDRRLRKVDLVAFRQTNKDPRALSTVAAQFNVGSFIKFAFGDRVIETVYNKPFRDKKAATEFAKRYIDERNEDFIIGSGKVTGSENLKPRQVHYLDGIGGLSGEWVFTQVRHVFMSNDIYECEFTCYRQGLPYYNTAAIKQSSTSFRFRQGDVVQNVPVKQ